MALNIEKLTLGEVAKIESLSGLPISAIGDDDKPKGLALAALAFVAKRREGESITWEQAQGLTFDEANTILGLGEVEEATGEDSTGSPVTTSSKRSARPRTPKNDAGS